MIRANLPKLPRCNSVPAAATIIIAAALAASPAAARDRGPELPPLECPIEGAVRVASSETLRNFSGLLANCSPLSVTVSPATTANRPRGEIRTAPIGSVPGEGAPTRQQDAPAGNFILAQGRDAKTTKKEEVRVERSADGSRVAIIPPPPPAETVVIAEVTPVVAEPVAVLDGDAETVLALRPRSYATAFDNEIAAAARRHGIDPLLLHAVITQESRYKQNAVSHAGARGLMQVMPQTGRGLGVADARHLFDARTNIDAGARLLKQLWVKYNGRMDLVLAAYNAGEGAVRRYGNAVPPFRETRDYVVKVKAIYTKLAGESGYLAVLD